MIPCQWCRQEFSTSANWHVCKACGFRVCSPCVLKHTGVHSNGGTKCSQCVAGWMERR